MNDDPYRNPDYPGWKRLESHKHPFEVYYEPEQFTTRPHYICMLCGGTVGNDDDDICLEKSCLETYKEYMTLLTLLAGAEAVGYLSQFQEEAEAARNACLAKYRKVHWCKPGWAPPKEEG